MSFMTSINIILYLINNLREFEEKDQCFITIHDTAGHFEKSELPQTIDFRNKTFSIKRINYFNQLQIDNNKVFDELIDSDNLILLYKEGKKHILERLDDWDPIDLEFSIIDCIISLFNFNTNGRIERIKENNKLKLIKEEIYIDFCKTVEFYNRNPEKLKILRELNLNDFFYIFLLFFSPIFFKESYSNELLKRIKLNTQHEIFVVSTPYELIELVFYLEKNYNSELLGICFNLMKPMQNRTFSSILHVVRIIIRDNNSHQDFLKNIFLIDLFQLRCGRGALHFTESDLALFNLKSKYSLTDLFDTVNSFCIFSEQYIKLIRIPKFKEYLKKNFVHDFETNYKATHSDFQSKLVNPINKTTIFYLENQMLFFKESYEKWIKTIITIIINDLMEKIIAKIKRNNFLFEEIKNEIEIYKQNIPVYIVKFFHYREQHNRIIMNLLSILENSLVILKEININNLIQWLSKDKKLIELIFSNDQKYREIRKEYSSMNIRDPCFTVLSNYIHQINKNLIFNEFLSKFYLQKFYKLMKSDYLSLVNNYNNDIVFTKDILHYLKDLLSDPNKKVILIVVDCLRYDIWDLIWREYQFKFNLRLKESRKILSLLPSITKVSRESIYFDKIKKTMMSSNSIKESLVNFIGIQDVHFFKLERKEEVIVGEIQENLKLSNRLNVIVTPYPDYRVHKIENIIQIYNDDSFNQIKNDIKTHIGKILRAIFESIKELNIRKSEYEIIFTSDHGFIDYYKKIFSPNIDYSTLQNNENYHRRYFNTSNDEELKNSFLNYFKDQIFTVSIDNGEVDTFIIPYGRYYFSNVNEEYRKSKAKIGHGGISYYENIIPFFSFKILDIEREAHDPSITIINEDKWYMSVDNLIELKIINNDPYFSIDVKTIRVSTENNKKLLEVNLSEEEGLIESNGHSNSFNLVYVSNKDRFKLIFEIHYYYYTEDYEKVLAPPLRLSRTFHQTKIQNPKAILIDLTDDGKLKDKLYNFQIELTNPNDFKIDCRLVLKPSKETDFHIFESGNQVEEFVFQDLESNEKYSKEISLRFNEGCKMYLTCEGDYTLPNAQNLRFKGEHSLSITVYKSDDEINQGIRTFTL